MKKPKVFFTKWWIIENSERRCWHACWTAL